MTELKKLKEDLFKELTDLKQDNLDAWKTYGSELSAGEMISKEKKLEEAIFKIEWLEKNVLNKG